MASFVQTQHYFKNPMFTTPQFSNKDRNFHIHSLKFTRNGKREIYKGIVCKSYLFPVDDPWLLNIDSEGIASKLSALSLFPYMGFLFFITKSNSAPRLTLFGFYFLLVFVAVTIPAGIYAKVHYMMFLSNVDWLHGGAESLLMLTNLFIILGLRGAVRELKTKRDNH